MYNGDMTKTLDQPELTDDQIEAAAAALRDEWRASRWECMSGVFSEVVDRLGYCVCCGFRPDDDTDDEMPD